MLYFIPDHHKNSRNIETVAVIQVESLLEQRDELTSRSQELDSTVAQLKAKEGELDHGDSVKDTSSYGYYTFL